MQTTVTLCADDFGLSPEICEGILELLANGCITATSCMVNQPDFVTYAKVLKEMHPQAQIGLHFNLTEGLWLTQKKPFNLYFLMIISHLRLLSVSCIAKEFKAQVDKFRDVMGFAPDFIDGHQHVHQFPQVRDAMLQVYEAEFKDQKPWIRCTFPSLDIPKYQWKGRVLAYTGGKSLQKILDGRDIPHPTYFAGIYDFDVNQDYTTLLKQWLERSKPNTLIMCHPAKELKTKYPIQSEPDRILRARFKEFEAFMKRNQCQPEQQPLN